MISSSIYYEDQNSPLQYTSLYCSWFLLQIYCKIDIFVFIFLLAVTTTILPSHACIFRSFHAICCIAHKHMEDWLLLQTCGYVYLLTYVVFILEGGMIKVKTKSNTECIHSMKGSGEMMQAYRTFNFIICGPMLDLNSLSFQAACRPDMPAEPAAPVLIALFDKLYSLHHY